MKPRTILADNHTYEENVVILAWLQANGCRWLIPRGARIIITGNRVIVPCWNIRSTKQSVTLWPKKLPKGWRPPVKIRSFKIRFPLNQDYS
ncbi:hypothetical protein [Arthrobacter glacialis]|uniref:hypothetical protein n=1 Tax=Arthrobacter glacialis TaxID=1664 RepID=UPI000CD486A7|nr:hypothetical protein [Arthrobacter glacialis]POH58901.1 hypothetical protein CVS28_09335 [Arthrobacter glacialis]